MPRRSRRYNFRYQAERERFYEDTKQDQDSIAERFEEFGFDSRIEFVKALRIVFDIGDYTSKDRKQHLESLLNTGKGEFRGVRSFIEFRTMKRFLDSTREGGSGIQWGKKEDENITARLCFYQRTGSRVTGEKVLARYVICTTQTTLPNKSDACE